MRELQQMMAAILMAREHTAAVAAAAAERPAQGFRWGWDPPGPRRTYNLDCLPATEFTGWKFGALHYHACVAYLSQLSWPAAELAPEGVTLIELVFDYEVTTGLDLIPASARQRGAGAPLLARTRLLKQLLCALQAQAGQDKPLFPGTLLTLCYSLQALGVPRSGGLSQRPVFLGGPGTERLLRELSATSTAPQLRTPRATGDPGHAGWASSYFYTHAPDRQYQDAHWRHQAQLRAPMRGRPASEPPPLPKRPRLAAVPVPPIIPMAVANPIAAPVCPPSPGGTPTHATPTPSRVGDVSHPPQRRPPPRQPAAAPSTLRSRRVSGLKRPRRSPSRAAPPPPGNPVLRLRRPPPLGPCHQGRRNPAARGDVSPWLPRLRCRQLLTTAFQASTATPPRPPRCTRTRGARPA